MTALRKLRAERGLTQEQFGELVGVTRAAVCLWESGKRWPSSEDLPRIAKTLGCSIDDLFAGDPCQEDYNKKESA